MWKNVEENRERELCSFLSFFVFCTRFLLVANFLIKFRVLMMSASQKAASLPGTSTTIVTESTEIDGDARVIEDS